MALGRFIPRRRMAPWHYALVLGAAILGILIALLLESLHSMPMGDGTDY